MSEVMVAPLQGEEVTVLKLQGNCRADTARLLLEQILQLTMTQNVLVDWEQAEHVDTCVLQVLLALQKHLGQRGFSFSVAKDSPAVREYVQLAGLSDALPLQSDQSPCREEAADA
jgi:anti-anti-sigma factor